MGKKCLKLPATSTTSLDNTVLHNLITYDLSAAK